MNYKEKILTLIKDSNEFYNTLLAITLDKNTDVEWTKEESSQLKHYLEINAEYNLNLFKDVNDLIQLGYEKSVNERV